MEGAEILPPAVICITLINGKLKSYDSFIHLLIA